LKNNKAAGYDQIVNEYLKVSNPRLIFIYCNIFSGVIPESWSIGIILPIYKNKGDPKDPDNYRAITLVSCLGKLFTAIINNRAYF
jgi:small basic protein